MTARPLVVLILGILSVPGFSSSASAWDYATFNCAAWCGVMSYSVGESSPDLEALGAGASVSEVQMGMGDWTLSSCTSLESSYLGRTALGPVDGDGESVVSWLNLHWPYDANVVGATTIRTAPGGCIVEADIAMNGVDYAWTTGPSAGSTNNAFSVVLHEAGHAYGLGHSLHRDAAMYSILSDSILTLEQDDENGICALYPGGFPPPDCNSTGCPLGQQCVMSVCEPGGPVPECEVDSECPDGEYCASDATCQPGGVGAGALGVSCVENIDCNSGFCSDLGDGLVCTATCDGLDTRSCPSGFYCTNATSDSCTVGLCRGGEGGRGGLGDVCAIDTDCASLMCSRDVCAVPCRESAECPMDFTCRSSGRPGCGACLPIEELGGECESNVDCTSDICVVLDPPGPGVCTDPCGTEADCPEGFLCEAFEMTSLCLEPAPPSGGCGCRVPGPRGASSPLLWLGLFFPLLPLIRRRRSR